jgi:hypothetical protein
MPLGGNNHASLLKYNGSISAEHGIGKLKRESLTKMKDPVALELMPGLKRMLDPNGFSIPAKCFSQGATTTRPFMLGCSLQ